MLLLGSYPPRECGIATFTLDVATALNRAFGGTCDIVAVDEPGGESRVYPREVVARLRQQQRNSYFDVAKFINAHPSPVLTVQHEYGLYGGEYGEWLIDLLDQVKKPVVLALHSILAEPEPAMLRVERKLCELSSKVVALSQTGVDLLVLQHGIDRSKVKLIHHGVPDVPLRPTAPAKEAFGLGDRFVISTFGLISRNKGLEYAIEAMNAVVDQHPEALYLILGMTHPCVRKSEGEAYRESLQAMVNERGLQNNVRLIDKYLGFDELLEYLAATDVYLTPYLSENQIVSGTLAYAAGCGKAMVSTPYLYAQELLAHGRGYLCAFRNADSIAQRLLMLLDDPAMLRATERRAYAFGRKMTWPHVANEYGEVFASLTGRLIAATA